GAGPGIVLTPLERVASDDSVGYRYVTAELDRAAGLVTITVRGPEDGPPGDAAGIHGQGAGFWPLAVTREPADLILWLRTNEPELGAWVIKTRGDIGRVLAYERLVAGTAGEDWLAAEIQLFAKRTLKRLDVTARSLIAQIEPGSCFAGALLELA